MSDQASNIWSKQVKTTNANPHKTIHIPHSFERRHFFVISAFLCWCVIVCAIFFCWCADIPAAERDMSVFSLWDGIRSWMVKRQILQERQPMQNTRNKKVEFFPQQISLILTGVGRKGGGESGGKVMNWFPDPFHLPRENSCMHTKSAGGKREYKAKMIF